MNRWLLKTEPSTYAYADLDRDLPAISVVDASSVATRTVKASDAPPGALSSPVRVIGDARVPASWEQLDDGFRSPVGDGGWVITVAEGATVSVREGQPFAR